MGCMCPRARADYQVLYEGLVMPISPYVLSDEHLMLDGENLAYDQRLVSPRAVIELALLPHRGAWQSRGEVRSESA